MRCRVSLGGERCPRVSWRYLAVGMIVGVSSGAILLLGSCRGSSSSTPAPRTAETPLPPCLPAPSSMLPVSSLTPAPARSSIWILEDWSQSVYSDGNPDEGYCTPQQRMVLHQLPQFLLTLAGELALDVPTEPSVEFGLAMFGPCREIITMTRAAELLERSGQWCSEPQCGGGPDTYAAALSRGAEVLSVDRPGAGCDESAVLLLTDGVFGHGDEDGIRSALRDLDRIGARVYVVLCNGAEGAQYLTDFWSSLRPVERVYYADRPILDWLPELTDALIGGMLPDRASGWLGDAVSDEVELPGDLVGVEIRVVAPLLSGGRESYFSWQDDASGTLGGGSLLPGPVPNLFEYRSSGVVPPGSACQPYRISISGLGPGFFWAESREPQVSPELARGTTTISVNNQPITIEVALASNALVRNVLRDRVECYQVQLQVPDGDSARDGGRFDDGLRTELVWQPQQCAAPREVSAQLVLMRDDGPVGQWPLSLQVSFRPGPAGPDPVIEVDEVFEGEDGRPDPRRDQLSMSFRFSYAAGLPEIFLQTALSQDEILSVYQDLPCDEEGVRFPCPFPNRQGEARVPYDTLSIDHPAVVGSTDSTSQYTLQVYRYVLTTCGYEAVVFRWHDSPDTLETEVTWECSLSQPTCTAVQ